MKTLVIGGTGLIGSEVVNELLLLNHEVTTIALDKPNNIEKDLNVIVGNYMLMSDSELFNILKDNNNLVFAAGIDERIEASPPIYDLFNKFNVESLRRILEIAKKAGIKNVSICGSYFTYFNRLYPKLELTKHHPYIRSRVEQLEMAKSFSDDTFSVAVIELPYIFGIKENRKPVWVFLVKIILKMKRSTYYSKGGTAMITIRQAGQAVVAALVNNKGFNSYPIGYYNMTFKEFFKIAHEGLNYSNRRKVIIIPNFIFKIGLKIMEKRNKKRGLESGLNLPKYLKMQTKNLFIEKDIAVKLGVTDDDIKKAIKDSMALSLKVIKDENGFIGMKTA